MLSGYAIPWDRKFKPPPGHNLRRALGLTFARGGAYICDQASAQGFVARGHGEGKSATLWLASGNARGTQRPGGTQDTSISLATSQVACMYSCSTATSWLAVGVCDLGMSVASVMTT